jgi:uncharacterized protein (DUF1499 family)
MKRWARRLLRVVLAIAALFALFEIIGPEHVWSLFGPPDLGPVHFKTLQRRTTPNDALACQPVFCDAKADVTSPLFYGSARDLRKAFASAIAGEPRLIQVSSDDRTLTDRYVQRSWLMHYPDTIVVQFFDVPNNRSTIALYSRSQLGKGDLGVNLGRINRWLTELVSKAKVATLASTP